MLSQKLLIDVGVDTFAAENRYRRLQLALGLGQIFMKPLSRAKLLAMSWQPAI
jgi:hypothetical protein